MLQFSQFLVVLKKKNYRGEAGGLPLAGGSEGGLHALLAAVDRTGGPGGQGPHREGGLVDGHPVQAQVQAVEARPVEHELHFVDAGVVVPHLKWIKN